MHIEVFTYVLCAWHKMWPVVTVLAWPVCLSFCLLVTNVSCAKTGEPTEMLFGM